MRALSAPGNAAVPHAPKLLRDDYIALGLSQVAQAVAFLNADCKMVRCCSLEVAAPLCGHPKRPATPSPDPRQRVPLRCCCHRDPGLAAALV